MKIFLLLFFALNLFGYERVVALSPSINEIVYALGSGDKIVGNTEFCTYPKEAIDKPKVGGYFSPSLEKILSLKPDLVIMQSNSKLLAKKLEKLGIQTKIIKLKTLEDITTSIKDIGDILKKEKKAKDILATIKQKLQATKNIINNKKILFVIGQNTTLEKRIFVAGQNLYFDDIITISGNKNAFQSTRVGQPVLNMENIIATNPDIVILLAPLMAKEGFTKQELINPWLKLPINASKNGNIFVEEREYAGIPSDRLSLFLEDFKGFLHNVKAK
ncbi:MAG: helical backbone metal receptor [Arcobacteraceae bacterium]|jgi:iron complex transport system substrate-binding protein|nr:helical backbone metal receptor [Arcobacteraceae bacterium]